MDDFEWQSLLYEEICTRETKKDRKKTREGPACFDDVETGANGWSALVHLISGRGALSTGRPCSAPGQLVLMSTGASE